MFKLKGIDQSHFYPFFFTIVFIFILVQYPLNSIDSVFYDMWIRVDLGAKASKEIVVIPMTEESDQFLGESYPYTYATQKKFIDKLLIESPLSINFFNHFNLPSTLEEEDTLKEFKTELTNFKDQGRGVRLSSTKDAWGELFPPEFLHSLGHSLSLINKDGNVFSKDDVTRRAILNVSGEDTIHLWIAKFYKKKKGLVQKEASQFKGSYYNRDTDAIYALFKYSSTPFYGQKGYSVIPYHQVIIGNYPKNFFKDKIVLVGQDYLSNPNNFYLTPFEKEKYVAPELLIHANIVDALISDKTVSIIPSFYTDIFSIILAILLALVISKVRPSQGLIILISLILIIFFTGYLLFVFGSLWVSLSHMILSVFVVYYIWVPFRAIGEYQRRYAIQEETKIIKKVEKLKHNFISLMSHDLKTPVAKIAGIADILKVQYTNTPKQIELINNISHSTKELNDFISSILDLTKIESENLDLKLESKDINVLIENLFQKLQDEASQNNIKMHLDLSPLYPINIDTVLINRVLANLIGNALKYSGSNTEIFVTTFDDDEWVTIEIADTGAGIPEEDLENIFDKFYRVKNDSNHKIKGSGLGLYLVKYFIELHGGEISVQSRLGHGTKFTVKLKNK